jgi:hypothetical protein
MLPACMRLEYREDVRPERTLSAGLELPVIRILVPTHTLTDWTTMSLSRRLGLSVCVACSFGGDRSAVRRRFRRSVGRAWGLYPRHDGALPSTGMCRRLGRPCSRGLLLIPSFFRDDTDDVCWVIHR